MNEAGVTYRTEHGEVTYSMQDMEDGRALRLLREAMPGHMVESYGPHPTTRLYLVQVVPHGWDDIGPVRRRASAEGSTIARAANKCREAIGRALEGSG